MHNELHVAPTKQFLKLLVAGAASCLHVSAYFALDFALILMLVWNAALCGAPFSIKSSSTILDSILL